MCFKFGTFRIGQISIRAEPMEANLIPRVRGDRWAGHRALSEAKGEVECFCHTCRQSGKFTSPRTSPDCTILVAAVEMR